MNAITKYINNKIIYSDLIDDAVQGNLELVVVIPCFNEDFEVLKECLNSLQAAQKLDGFVEVYILINQSEYVSPEISKINELCYHASKEWASANNNEQIRYYPLWIKDLASKKAGVGLARKIAMDMAFLRLHSIDKNGLIVNLDADTLVAKDYFIEIDKFFNQNEDITAGGIHFEHPLEEIPLKESKAIIQYELHLRYFINMQKWANLAFGFQTIGSAMVVRSNAYIKVAGMNTRKAGEDFYFLHKFIKTNSFAEINTTTIYPSSRISDRVPFGTGKAVADHINLNQEIRSTYNPQSFIALNLLIIDIRQTDNIESIFKEEKYDPCVISYFNAIDYKSVLKRLHADSKDNQDFINRFFIWFDAFKFMKYLHHCRDLYYKNIPLDKACKVLCSLFKLKPDSSDLKSMLMMLRKHDKNQSN